MNKSILILLFGALALSQATPATADEPESSPAGFWEGTLEYRDDMLDVRISISETDGALNAHLDLPEMVYSRQAMDISLDENQSVALEFPFGIGQMLAHPDGPDTLRGGREGFELELARSQAPTHTEKRVRFGGTGAELEGTLYLPAGQGPHSVVIVIAGSGNANRGNWSYSSWADFYLAQGLGALVYDRRPDLEALPDGSIAGIEDHASDVVDAIRVLRQDPGVDAAGIGLAGHSRGCWIAMSVVRQEPGLAFLVLGSVAPATPAEQETTSILTGMRDDGMGPADLAEARAYLRLYYYVAQTGSGWDLLASSIAENENSDWLQYVDQPRSLDDLDWWRQNMNFDAVSHLEGITVPVLALWGGADFITPWADYRLKLESALESAGNKNVTTRVYPNADHRLEVGFGEDEAGQWHWFGIAPGALETVSKFVRRTSAQASRGKT